MGHYDNCRDGYCAACGAAPGNMLNGYCMFCNPAKYKAEKQKVAKNEKKKNKKR